MYDSKLKPFINDIKTCTNEIIINGITFDCGFFEISIQLIFITFDLVMLLVLTK